MEITRIRAKIKESLVTCGHIEPIPDQAGVVVKREAVSWQCQQTLQAAARGERRAA